MARLLQAVRDYGPKLIRGNTVQLKGIADFMSMRTGLNKSEVMMVLQEIQEVILYFVCQGMSVKFPGVGTFSASIGRDGTLRINFRSDKALRNGINVPDAYTGKMLNKDCIGLDNAGYKVLWDADHPNDLLEI